MPAVRLAAGAVYEFPLHAIEQLCFVHRFADGYPGHGWVGWAANDDDVLHEHPLDVDGTVSFLIGGRAGRFGNATPSSVLLLWDNEPPVEVDSDLRALNRLFRRDDPSPQRVDDPADDAMRTLNKQWYKAVVTGCGLSDQTFQLVQGNSPLGTTTEPLWNIFDAVPPATIDSYYNPSQANLFSTNYGAVINNLIVQNSNKFQRDMGDYYAPWCDYLRTNPTFPSGGYLALFDAWAATHMPPDRAQVCHTDYRQICEGTVPVAVEMWYDACKSNRGLKAYNATIDDLSDKLAASPGRSVSLDSSRAKSDIDKTWAKADASFAFDLFKIGGSGSYTQLSQSLVKDGLNIDAKFDRLVTFTAAPLARASSEPILDKFQPWFSSAALNLAFQHDDNTVWNRTPPTWDDTFGPGGNIKRTTSAIVVVDGITITMRSETAVHDEQRSEVEAAAKTGWWPFFQASGSGGWNHHTVFDSKGIMTVRSTCKPGNPQILGVIVTPFPAVVLNG